VTVRTSSELIRRGDAAEALIEMAREGEQIAISKARASQEREMREALPFLAPFRSA